MDGKCTGTCVKGSPGMNRTSYLGLVSFGGLLGHIRCCMGFSFKLDPFIEQSETQEKIGAERPRVLVL